MAKWLISSLVLVVLLGVAVYIYAHKQSSMGQTSTTTPQVSTAEVGTSTYENTTYHFAFDYPKTTGTSTVAFNGKDARDLADPSARFDGTLYPVGLTIEVDAKPKNFTSAYFSDQFAAEKKERANASFTLSTTTTSIASIQAFTVEGIGRGIKEEEILLEHGAYIYSIGYSLPNGTSSKAIQTVLDTFRFTQ